MRWISQATGALGQQVSRASFQEVIVLCFIYVLIWNILRQSSLHRAYAEFLRVFLALGRVLPKWAQIWCYCFTLVIIIGGGADGGGDSGSGGWVCVWVRRQPVEASSLPPCESQELNLGYQALYLVLFSIINQLIIFKFNLVFKNVFLLYKQIPSALPPAPSSSILQRG